MDEEMEPRELNAVENDDQQAQVMPSVEQPLPIVTEEDVEAGDTCRICRGEATPEQPLFYPCKCSGSIKYVHQECLMEWLSHSQKKYCELCKTSFRFTKLYDQSMPDDLPMPLFVRQVSIYGLKTIGKWLRYSTVILVWTCCLPWVIRQIWRGLFWLADGSWMSEGDLHRLLVAETSSQLLNHTFNATSPPHLDPATQTVLVSAHSPASILFSLVTGDALLRGLLRLITFTASTASLTSIDDNEDMNSTSVVLWTKPRRSSLLSEVQSLNTITNNPTINNGLLDILEGQLICLSIIAAFILVFLIREWVINQQPVHMMPDPDQAEGLAPQGQQEGAGRQVARRRLLDVGRVPAQDGQPEVRMGDAGQRRRAVPRARRAVPELRTNVSPQSDQPQFSPQTPARTSSISLTESSSKATDHERNVSNSPSVQEPSWQPLDVQSPPLQRGIFDEAADIRRSIEEHPESDIEGRATNLYLQPHSVETPIGTGSGDLDAPGVSAQPFNFAAFSRRNGSSEFTFTSSASFEPTIDSSSSSFDEKARQIAGDEQYDFLDEPETSHTSSELGSTAVVVEGPDAEQPDVGVIAETHAMQSSAATETTSNGVQVDEPKTLLEIVSIWLWPDPTNTTRIAFAPAAAHGAGGIPNDTEFVHIEAADLDDAFLPAANPPPAEPAPQAPGPAREPNIQFGIDLNDPNAMDDAEDLEGILEIIGMEGPIAGMLQNLIFSVFLITITLTASVWCPYIWGKIALLVVSHPVGVFFKAPLFFFSRFADLLVDTFLLLVGISGLAMAHLTKLARSVIQLLLPQVARKMTVNAVESLAVNVTRTSSTRLEKILSSTIFHLRPDLPTFSMHSHYALRVFQSAAWDGLQALQSDMMEPWRNLEKLWQTWSIISVPLVLLKEVLFLPTTLFSAIPKILAWVQKLSHDLAMPSFRGADQVDMSLMDWNTKDKVLTIIVGYAFFAISGMLYLRVARFVLGLKDDQKVEGVFADSLRQAGGVMKVIVIIGIEMIAFPLYCGWLLDIALLPLFAKANLTSRLIFISNAPITGAFVHWFIGTCYMFHFALFVSMCRKIMRRGVLYFIRDPDDPTFHPVRDVLERPVFTQLSKIAFSACVYGILLLLCLGGVVWTISHVDGIFPIRWASSEPYLAFPIDVIFFNFLLPFFIRTAEPSKKISNLYAWWFRVCARYLRLSHFLFGDERQDEMRSVSWFGSRSDNTTPAQASNAGDGTDTAQVQPTPLGGRWVRAPASDSVRIPKGTKVFVEVNESNERTDGVCDREKGIHGKNDERFAKIFIPSNFRLRVAAFVFLVWLFAASTGVACTLGPLIIGRVVLKVLSGSKYGSNDLYAYSAGLNLSGAIILSVYTLQTHYGTLKTRSASFSSNMRVIVLQLIDRMRYAISMIYLGVTIGVIIPVFLSLLVELYIHMPIYGYLLNTASFTNPVIGGSASKPVTDNTTQSSSSPTIYLVQSWTLGLLYLRLLIRASIRHSNGQTRLATAMRSMVRNGLLHPDVRLTSRGFVLPIITLSTALLVFPIASAKVYIAFFDIQDGAAPVVYRHSYPIILILALSAYLTIQFKHKIEGWQSRVRDEIYLVGERLHNFAEPLAEKATSQNANPKTDKGKDRAIIDVAVHNNDSDVITTGAIPSSDVAYSTGINVENSSAIRREHIDSSQLEGSDAE